jgi:two-component system chemotaxis sensor kinase CheA
MDVNKYAALFLAESQEHLRSCNRLLLEWERAPAATEPVGGLFRAIHTIKGMAATMGYTGVADLAHRTENLLDALRSGRATIGPDTFATLFRAVDAIADGVEASAAGRHLVPSADLLAALDRAAGERRHAEADAIAPAAIEEAAGRTVRVAIRPDAMMRGARAALVLRRAESLGAVSAVQPPPAALEREEFDGRLSFRLASDAAADAIVALLATAGDVLAVEVEDGAAAEAPGAAPRVARQIRVDLDRLDALMKQVGELVVARNRLTALVAGSDDPDLVGVSERIGRLASSLQGEVLQARMTPVGEVFERFPRLVRDLARELGKEVRLVTEGEEIELDRSVLDEIGDPLVHLLRNALDHGVEPPDAREAAGKRREGRIVISAARERNSVALRVSDDGRGIDRARILAKAKREGAVDPSVEGLSEDQLVRVLARAGFSTAERVSGVSGRGVGIDVAATRIRQLGGSLELATEPGRGTTWTLRVPLTLAIVRALLAGVGRERYAVPLAYVAETVEFAPKAVTAVRDREALVVRDRVVPTVHLRQLFTVPGDGATRARPAVILELGERRAALVVDSLLGQQDIVVEPFDAPAGTPPFFSGATILADGAPALILDAAALI